MRKLGVSLSVVACLLAVVPGAAQEWRGEGRARGVVLDDDGEPLAGARVELEWTGEGGGGPDGVVTGDDGAWSFVLLAPGVWRISIEAPDFQPSEGWVRVPEEGPGSTTTVSLRSLDEVSPSFAEGNPRATVERWLEKGDALLEQGRAGEARSEYERVLRTPGVLDAAARAEVLEAVARTHYLEGTVDEAVRVLQAAIVQNPDGGRARQLLTVLLGDRGRAAEAKRFFERLEQEPEALAGELADLLEEGAGRRERELPERPVLPPEPGRVGRFRTAFTEASPLSGVDLFVERYGYDRSDLEAVDVRAGAYDLAEETFEVYVPEDYAAGGDDAPPWGLLVWISPGLYGGLDTPELQQVLARHRLLWVGANRSGNERFTWNRVALALDGARAMVALYDVDRNRVYAAGYSGGGRVASGLALLYPEVFRGALCLFGVDFYLPVSVPYAPGNHWPASFPAPPAEELEPIREHGRFVLVTGERDFNRSQTRATHEEMKRQGFEHAVYLEIPEADHYHRLEAEELDRALAALDPR